MRLQLHKIGSSGARLMEVVSHLGITWELASVIECDSYETAHELEKRLKKHSAARRCPLCKRASVDLQVFLREGHWPLTLHTKQGKHCPMSTHKPPLFVRIEREVLR